MLRLALATATLPLAAARVPPAPIIVADGTSQRVLLAWLPGEVRCGGAIVRAKLAPRTKADHTAALARIEAKSGAYPLDPIEDPKIRGRFLDWRDEMATGSPRQADAVLGVLRIVLEWGRDRGITAHDHATRPKKVYKADRADKLWLPPT